MPHLTWTSCVALAAGVALAGCGAPAPALVPPPADVALHRSSRVLPPPPPPPVPMPVERRRALEAEWPPVDFAPEVLLPADDPPRVVRADVRWVPPGAPAVGRVIEAQDRPPPVRVRVVRGSIGPARLVLDGE